MVCKKCGYQDEKEVKLFGSSLCRVCASHAPEEVHHFQDYVLEKLDWKRIDTFRKYGQFPGKKQKLGMAEKAFKGKPVTRAPKGYDIIEGDLQPNKDSGKIYSLFRTFLARNYSLNSLAKNFSLSVNGLKKILTNRTYLGEIKFDNRIYKGNHKLIIPPEIFYAVQRKLKEYLKPRKKH
jgi:hypothetical protein